MRERVIGRLAATAAAAICVAVLPSYGEPRQALDVRVENNRVSLHAVDVGLSEVLRKLADATGLEMTGTEGLSRPTTVQLSGVPIVSALAALLDGIDYILLERAGSRAGEPVTLHLHVLPTNRQAGRHGAMPGPNPVRVPALEAFVAAEKSEEHENRLDEEQDPDWDDERRDNRLEASRLAAEGAFRPDADLQSLLALMDHEDNPEVRLQALLALAPRQTTAARRRTADALGDEDWTVRTAAVDLLGRATDRESLAILERMLETNTDTTVRIGILRVLAMRAVESPSLRVALQDTEAVVREAAAQLLGELERRRAAGSKSR